MYIHYRIPRFAFPVSIFHSQIHFSPGLHTVASTFPIAPCSLELTDMKAVRALKYLPDSPLLACDSWGLRIPLQKEFRNIKSASRVTEHILDNNHKLAWKEIETGIKGNPLYLTRFKNSVCSRFLALLPDGSIDSAEHFPKAWTFCQAMKKAGYELSTRDYTNLLNLMFKAHDYYEVQAIWDEIQIKTPEMLTDVNLWNAYIQASCQTYPLFWPGAGSEAKRLSEAEAPPLAADVVDVLQRMEVNGVVPNARTCELVMLAFARQNKLSLVQSIMNKAWLSTVQSEDGLLYPSHSTLASIIEAYAFNNELPQGIQEMLKVQEMYNIPLSNQKAIHMWTRALRHATVNVKPSGIYERELFDQLWQLAMSHNISPSPGMWSIRIQALTKRNDFEALVADLPKIMAMQGEVYQKLAETALTRVVKGYTNTGRALEGLGLLGDWAHKGLDLRVKLQNYVHRRSGMTVEQLKMYKEDDDDDNWGL